MPNSAQATYPTGSLLASEIAQQPELWLTTLERVRTSKIRRDFEDAPVVLTGAGTSAYAGMAIAAAWPGAQAIPTTDLLVQSSTEIEAAVPRLAHGGVLISLARSGESPESSAVVAKFQRVFPLVRHLAIVCNPAGRLAQMPGIEVISLDARANDRSLAMTSSFSNLTLAGLCLLHDREIAGVLPRLSEGLHARLPEMYRLAMDVAQHSPGRSADRLVVLTSNMHGLGLEASLKVIELTAGRVLGMAETFLGFRHGPISFLREDTPVLCFASSDPTRRAYEKDMIEELKARGLGFVVVIGDESAAHWPGDLFVQASAPGLPDHLRTPFEIPFAQLVAYHCSLQAQVNPDNPSPDGTVTRVVKPFVIHDETS